MVDAKASSQFTQRIPASRFVLRVFFYTSKSLVRETPLKPLEGESYIAAHRVESVGWYGGNAMLGRREIVSFALVNSLDDGDTHCTEKSLKHNYHGVIAVIG